MNASLGSFRLCLFGLPPSCEALLLRSVMRTGFQFIVLTLVAVEENDLLCVFGLRHGVWTSGIAPFTFVYFRSSTRRRFLLQFDLIVINRGTDEIFESTRINLITLEKIDRSSRVAFQAR